MLTARYRLYFTEGKEHVNFMQLRRHDKVKYFICHEQAIGYLRKEAVVLDSSVPRGYILLTYKKIPLGFAKNIGNRANNLYPQEWRIRSGYLPDVLSMVWDD